MRTPISIIFILLSFSALSQSAADWWYFGNKAGVHFLPSGVVSDTNGELITQEGCASISSEDGDLLFYTDGTTVYAQDHSIMPNGQNLLGHSSSSQSALITGFPGQPDKYLIFTVPVAQNVPMCYSVVDMNLNGGLGDVVAGEKNVEMLFGMGENLCAITHGLGNGFWILSHMLESDTVTAFEVNSSGVNLNPIKSATGDSITALVGCMKASQNGKFVCYASEYKPVQASVGRIKLMRFNNITGQITQTLAWSSPLVRGPYGVEFSSNSKVLYVSDGWNSVSESLVQYNISNFNLPAILASEYEVADNISFGQVQIGPDQNIYLSSDISANGKDKFLHRINNPNVLGAGCNFDDKAIHLQGRSANLGLPPFNPDVFLKSMKVVNKCFGEATCFLLDQTNLQSALWNFDDPASGSNNISTELNPCHVFSDVGTYEVSVVFNRDNFIDSLVVEVEIIHSQEISFDSLTWICRGDSVILDINQPISQYLWHDGSTDGEYLVEPTDSLIWATVIGSCDTVSDSTLIVWSDTLEMSLPDDTLLCDLNSFLIEPDVNERCRYSWSSGQTSKNLFVDRPGKYKLKVVNGCNSVSDSLRIRMLDTPTGSYLPGDSVHCNEKAFNVTVSDSSGYEVLWSDSSTGAVYTISESDTLWLLAYNDCGSSLDSMKVDFRGIPDRLPEDTMLCEALDVDLSVYSGAGARYIWSTGDTTSTINIREPDNYYSVSISNSDCTLREEISITWNDIACESIDCDIDAPNIFTPNGDGVNDIWKITSTCELIEFDVVIYNRWGQIVYQSHLKNGGWDGFINGEPAQTGVYFYDLISRDEVVVDADREEVMGSLTLIR